MHQEEFIVDRVEKPEFIVGLRSDGIYHVYLKDYTVIDLALQSDLLKVYEKMTQGKKGYFIFEAGHKCNVTKDARDNATKMEDIFPVAARVVFVQNMVYRMIANLYYRINQPKVPFHVTDNFGMGIKWLKECKLKQIGVPA